MRLRLSVQMMRDIEEHYAQTHNRKWIASQVGCSVATVVKHLTKVGLLPDERTKRAIQARSLGLARRDLIPDDCEFQDRSNRSSGCRVTEEHLYKIRALYVEGFTLTEIAAISGFNYGTVAVHIRNTPLAAFERIVQERGVNYLPRKYDGIVSEPKKKLDY